MDDDIVTCQATRADGQPCEAKARPSGYCWAHDPELAEQRRAGNAEGGSNSSRYARTQRLLPRDLKPVLHLAIKALQEVHDGAITPSQGSAIAALIGAVSKLYGLVELEQQIADLEVKHGVAE